MGYQGANKLCVYKALNNFLLWGAVLIYFKSHIVLSAEHFASGKMQPIKGIPYGQWSVTQMTVNMVLLTRNIPML